jgi:hypothetical protein
MLLAMEEALFDAALKDIERDGYTVMRNVLSKNEVEAYRQECAREFDTAPRLEGKVYVPGKTPNYVQPWMIHGEKHLVASYRLYQFYHNALAPNEKHIVDVVVGVRDRLEKRWPEIQEYNKKNNLVDYNIIAKYAPESGFQSIHKDAEGKLSHPALQCEILLTEPGIDYKDGDLLLHLFDGRVISTNEAKVHVGDLIVFDKRLDHEVTATLPAEGGKGRWMALIGAKTFPRKKRSPYQDLRLKISRSLFLNAPVLHSLLKSVLGKKSAKDPFATY